MNKEKETPEMRRKNETRGIKKASSSIHGSNLSDLVGGLGWKGTGILILLAILGFIIYAVFFR